MARACKEKTWRVQPHNLNSSCSRWAGCRRLYQVVSSNLLVLQTAELTVQRSKPCQRRSFGDKGHSDGTGV